MHRRVRTRVVITTCDKDVAIVASGKGIPLHLQSLTDKESWKLFLNKAHIPEDSLNDLVLIVEVGRVWLELPSPIHFYKPNTSSIRKPSTSRIVTPCNSRPMTYIYIY